MLEQSGLQVARATDIRARVRTAKDVDVVRELHRARRKLRGQGPPKPRRRGKLFGGPRVGGARLRQVLRKRSSWLRRGEGGAGRDRTAVQTTATWAFYMRSRFIGFRPVPGEWHPSTGLGPVSYLCSGPPHKPVLHDDTSGSGRRITGLPERYSSALLLFARIKPNSLRLLSCESVVYFASYGVDALGYGPHITPGMLTHITKPLSNPGRPQGKERGTKVATERCVRCSKVVGRRSEQRPANNAPDPFP